MTVNWTATSELALIDLTTPRLIEIEGVGNTAQTNNARKEAWKGIHEALQAQQGLQHSDPHKIKKKWQHMKSLAKQKLVGMRAWHAGTGGGGPCPIILSVCEEKILDVMGERRGFRGEANPVGTDIMAGAAPTGSSGPMTEEELEAGSLMRGAEAPWGDEPEFDEDAAAAAQHAALQGSFAHKGADNPRFFPGLALWVIRTGPR
eukprot:GHVU01082144.1.p1 GENE.GHVU01082144.1~~GHVU01082144.1.p1  ORF type:complete len:204 (+),score=29.10 GHVU01082144.1:500-1111(+)